MQINVGDFPTPQVALQYLTANGGGQLVFGPGRHRVERQPPGSFDRFSALNTNGKNIEIVGAGIEATTIYCEGDAEARTYNLLQFNPGAANITVRDLSIDTTGLYNTDEQTHAIQIGSGVFVPGTEAPVENVVIQRVRIHHGGLVGERKGDAIRVVGYSPETRVSNWKILDVDVMSSARSGFAMQRNSDFGMISRCFLNGNKIRHSMIDDEATGGQGSKGLRIEGCTLVRTEDLATSDNYAISLTTRSHFQILGNTLIGKGISLVRGSRGIIKGNLIDALEMNESAVVDIANAVSDLTIEGNTIRRSGPKSGMVVKIQVRNLGFCDGLILANNHLISETDGAVVYLSCVNDALVHNNRIVGAYQLSSTGLYADAPQRDVESMSIQNNTFRGCSYAAVRLVPTNRSGSVWNFRGGVIANNTGFGRMLLDLADRALPASQGGISIGSNYLLG